MNSTCDWYLPVFTLLRRHSMFLDHMEVTASTVTLRGTIGDAPFEIEGKDVARLKAQINDLASTRALLDKEEKAGKDDFLADARPHCDLDEGCEVCQ